MFRTSAVTLNEYSNSFLYNKLNEEMEFLEDLSGDLINLSLREQIKIREVRDIVKKLRDQIPPWN